MTEALYLTDAYRRGCDGAIVAVHDGGVVLDATVFYPDGGGQPGDTGSLTAADGSVWKVTAVTKSPGGIVHQVEPTSPPELQTRVRAEIDWARRYQHMRYHTCLHLLSGAVFRKFGAGITGGQIYEDRARTDFSMPEFNRSVAEELIAEVNRVVVEDHPIAVRFLPRAEAEKDPSLVRVAADLMPDVTEVRLIDIVGYDVQADGGTHVRSTREVGAVRLDRIENKGAKNKRLYLVLGSPATLPALAT
ncbi:MAG: alanyl-tRNA editing protein [Thermoplasmata archaeon]|nr:alanyl-tRNA editing protein [Thermoplasmata archaeon]